MKVAILSESEADETVIRVFVDALLQRESLHISHAPLQARGWPAVLNILPAVIKYLYYSTDAAALIVLADSNHTPVHQPAPEHTGEHGQQCRLCLLRESATRTLQGLRPVTSRGNIRVAVGLAVPSLEAWLLCGRDPTISESTWRAGLESKHDPYTRNALKQRVYGTDRPNGEMLKRRGTEEARRLIQDLALLETRFPGGFGLLATEIRSWITP